MDTKTKLPIQLRSDVAVRLMQHMGSDQSIVAAARVSVQGVESAATYDEDAEGHAKLIKFLMRNRHGCYDSETEVLTDAGWKAWPEVEGTEQFLTLNLETDEIEYQRAERLVRRSVRDEPMCRLNMAQVDALVTMDHNMVVAPRERGNRFSDLTLLPAHELFNRTYRLHLGGGEWQGEIHEPELAELVGFIAADAHVARAGASIEFHLRKQRKIDWLLARWPIQEADDKYFLRDTTEDLLRWAKATYTPAPFGQSHTRQRCFPRELLRQGDVETIQALLDGYLVGDGHTSATGKVTCSTSSRQMVNDLQEAAVKAGMAAVETSSDVVRAGAYGSSPSYRLTFYRPRNMQPRIGWTAEARQEQVRQESYTGEIHCVTVPNGTLYVRRNGKPMWCGNTPFEHNSMTFLVEAPIFVFREFHRHRVWSYNETSGRYKELEPVFWVPDEQRRLIQTGKPGAYVFEPGTQEQYEQARLHMEDVYQQAWQSYQNMLQAGIAREVARVVLPVSTYSAMYATANARAVMHFLSLRTKREGATFPSFPMREIEQVAEQIEALFAEKFPHTYAAFQEHGRVAP